MAGREPKTARNDKGLTGRIYPEVVRPTTELDVLPKICCTTAGRSLWKLRSPTHRGEHARSLLARDNRRTTVSEGINTRQPRCPMHLMLPAIRQQDRRNMKQLSVLTACNHDYFEWRAGCVERRKSGAEKDSGAKLPLVGWVGPGLFYINSL